MPGFYSLERLLALSTNAKWAMNFPHASILSPIGQLYTLLLVAFFFGGGGSAYGLANFAVQGLSIVILAFNYEYVGLFVKNAPRPLFLLICATIALPVAQLIPIPPKVWTELPGRTLLEQSLELIGRPNAWYPITLSPARTSMSLFSLFPALTVFILGFAVATRDVLMAHFFVVLLAVPLLFLGVIQVVSHGDYLFYGGRTNAQYLYATFANHNTTGIFLCVCVAIIINIPISSLVPEIKVGITAKRACHAFRAIFAAAVSFGVILTQSRSSMALLLLILAAKAVSAIGRRAALSHLTLKMCAFYFAIGIAVVGVLVSGPRFQDSFSRFYSVANVRPAIWTDTAASVLRFWPVGSGISTFPEVFEVDESLEHVWAFHSGRAHNDYLELAQEAGIFGIALVASWGIFIAYCFLSVWQRRDREAQSLSRISLYGLSLVALQSFVDYPLRNQAMLILTSLLLVLLTKLTLAERLSGRVDKASPST